VVLPDWLQQEMGLKPGSCLSIYRDKEHVALLPITDEFIRILCGSLKGDYSLVEDRERDHRIEKRR
jgi:bifunctional DNA-binding transcriptional regulator/antitoxin component of YhaV-PrlF toxin-antitoxin module